MVAATCQFVGVQMKRASESIMSFPPPLRTMEGEKSLQRRQHYFTCMKGTEVVVDDTATAKTSIETRFDKPSAMAGMDTI